MEMNGYLCRSLEIHGNAGRFTDIPRNPMNPLCTTLWSLHGVSARAPCTSINMKKVNGDPWRSMGIDGGPWRSMELHGGRI